jgi:hypothetical protein
MLWLANAESSHATRPFRAIIATSNPSQHPFVLVADDLDESIALWHVPREGKVARDARAMADCVSLLFHLKTRSILFIDPNFKPEAERFRRPLIEFLGVALDVFRRTGRRLDTVEYHLEAACTSTFFVDECKRSLLSRIPRGCTVTFVRWKQRVRGEDLHARYVLTESGGFRFDRGLDDGEPGEVTDVGPLAHALYSERWNDFQPDPAAAKPSTYELEDRIRVVGGKEVVLLP